MNGFSLLFAGLALITVTGCSTLSTVNPRTMTADDVMTMTEAGVGADVIKRQIEATNSRFELSTDQIVQLKKAGVADDVLTAMIDSGSRPEYYSTEYGSEWLYDPLYTGYYGSYGYPYSVYLNPGLIGRFYSYYPLSPGVRYWNDYYRYHDPYNNDETTSNSDDTGKKKTRNRDLQIERRQ